MADYLNDKRQQNIDFAKVLSIVFMIMIHSYMLYTDDFSKGFLYVLNSILGGPFAAPVFMVSMGVGFAYSRKQEPKNFIKRGVWVFLLGYLLNIIIYPEVYTTLNKSKEMFLEKFFTCFTYGDIFHFAGLAMMLFGLLRMLKLKDFVIMLIGFALSFLLFFIPVILTDNYFVASVFGLFIPIEHEVCPYVVFPLFTWFIFPSFGYWFGNRLRNIKNLNAFYLWIGIISTIIVICGLGTEIYFNFGMMNKFDDLDYYFMKTYESIICICCCLCLYSVSYYVVKLFSPKVNDVIKSISDSLNIIYFIQWIILTYISILIYCFVDEVSLTYVHIISACCVIVIIPLGVAIKNYLKKHPKSVFRFLNP